MFKPRKPKPAKQANTHPVYRLADAVYDVYHKADIWESTVRVYQGDRRCYEEMKEAQEDLGQAIDAAVNAIDGTDYYVREMLDTKPGVWSSRLKGDLRQFGYEVLARGDMWFSNWTDPGPLAAGPDPADIDIKDRNFRDWLNAFRKEQRDLHKMDVSALERPWRKVVWRGLVRLVLVILSKL